MGVERRGRLIVICSFDQPGVVREESSEQVDPQDKSFDISKQLVWEAYEQVKANKGAPGWMGSRWRSSRRI